MKDFGYDVSDYCGVDPVFGSPGDFDRLASEARRRGFQPKTERHGEPPVVHCGASPVVLRR